MKWMAILTSIAKVIEFLVVFFKRRERIAERQRTGEEIARANGFTKLQKAVEARRRAAGIGSMYDGDGLLRDDGFKRND